MMIQCLNGIPHTFSDPGETVLLWIQISVAITCRLNLTIFSLRPG